MLIYELRLKKGKSEEERKQILRRTIPKEIELEQAGYHVRQPNF